MNLMTEKGKIRILLLWNGMINYLKHKEIYSSKLVIDDQRFILIVLDMVVMQQLVLDFSVVLVIMVESTVVKRKLGHNR
jgi:hypothetical protein